MPDEFPTYQPPVPEQQPAQEPPTMRCPNCGGTAFDPGYVEDTGQGAVRWYNAEATPGLFGGLPRFGIDHFYVLAYRCQRCRRLELYAGEQG